MKKKTEQCDFESCFRQGVGYFSFPAGAFSFSFVIAFFISPFFSCNSSSQQEQRVLAEKVDSLYAEVSKLKALLEEKKETSDTLPATPQQKDTSVTLTAKETLKETAPLEKKKPQPPKPTAPQNDTTYHYYDSGKLSVKITPWSEGKRKLFFYDLKGAQTFELEDVRMSYSITTQLKFHPNGAASVAEIHTNPGASRYWYETEITFDTANEPLLRYDRQMPQERIDLEENLPSFWNKQKQQWVKQEIVKETSTPR